MKVKQFSILCFLCAPIIFPDESTFFQRLLFSKEIVCGAALLGAARYYDADYIKNRCTVYQQKTIWKRSSHTDFTDGSTGKEIVFSNEEIKKKIKLILMPGDSYEKYEFYDNNKSLIESTAPASPAMKDDDKIVEHLSEIRIIPLRHASDERQLTVYKKSGNGQWIRNVINEIRVKNKTVYIDQRKEKILLGTRKIIQGVGCACILFGATRDLYSWLYR